jgi:hypothetical protein
MRDRIFRLGVIGRHDGLSDRRARGLTENTRDREGDEREAETAHLPMVTPRARSPVNKAALCLVWARTPDPQRPPTIENARHHNCRHEQKPGHHELPLPVAQRDDGMARRVPGASAGAGRSSAPGRRKRKPSIALLARLTPSAAAGVSRAIPEHDRGARRAQVTARRTRGLRVATVHTRLPHRSCLAGTLARTSNRVACVKPMSKVSRPVGKPPDPGITQHDNEVA